VLAAPFQDHIGLMDPGSAAGMTKMAASNNELSLVILNLFQDLFQNWIPNQACLPARQVRSDKKAETLLWQDCPCAKTVLATLS
jgi:hypothetical protein